MAASGDMTDPVYWRYQVIRQGYAPAESDDFYDYSVMGGTTSTITVIKAALDPVMNVDQEFLEADPKAYLIIREDRLRLAGVVLFHTREGERISDAITIEDDDINLSYNSLSQTNLSVVPQLIPPFPLESIDRDVVLEDGQIMSTLNATGSVVDVIYENSIDGTLISETWAEGEPWALFSVTSTTESRLMDPAEVDDIRGGVVPDTHDDPDDASYTELLRRATKLTDALKITDAMIGTTSHEVGAGRKPWAGSYWPQAKGALVFGIEDNGANDTTTKVTISHIGKSIFVSPGRTVQDTGDELRDIRKESGADSDEYRTKVQEYRDAQKSLVDGLVAFYNAVRAGIDSGRITIENDRIKADANWNNATGEDVQYEAFDFELDRLSPFDKYALIQQLEGRGQGNNPWFTPAWELLNHWSPSGSSWFGHCNGWAAAAILMKEPRVPQTVNFGANDEHTVELSTADLKGLASETHYSGLSHFFGSRYNDEDDDITDLSPKSVLQLLEVYVNQRGVPFVFDTTAGDQVWNFPVWKYTLNLTETTVGGASAASGLININTAGQSELETLWGVSTVRGSRIIAYRQAHGPFQTTEDIIKVRGIGRGIYNRMKDSITVDANTNLRTFDGNIRATFSTDGVDETHLDTDQENPRSFDKTWYFTMEASPAGEIISSAWDDDNEHPDFGWTPYANTLRSGSSENPFLNWLHLKTHFFADDALRE
jgi:competence protein ComEA